MEAYTIDVERMMQKLFVSLNESERRRYAAVEAAKLGHGGIEYVARVLGCDAKTIQKGLQELQEDLPLATDRQRKKGVAASRSIDSIPSWKRIL